MIKNYKNSNKNVEVNKIIYMYRYKKKLCKYMYLKEFKLLVNGNNVFREKYEIINYM